MFPESREISGSFLSLRNSHLLGLEFTRRYPPTGLIFYVLEMLAQLLFRLRLPIRLARRVMVLGVTYPRLSEQTGSLLFFRIFLCTLSRSIIFVLHSDGIVIQPNSASLKFRSSARVSLSCTLRSMSGQPVQNPGSWNFSRAFSATVGSWAHITRTAMRQKFLSGRFCALSTHSGSGLLTSGCL